MHSVPARAQETYEARKTAEDCLWRAIESVAPEDRERWARIGLARIEGTSESETRVLLLRQLYLACLAAMRLEDALEAARSMVEHAHDIRDIAYHDVARVEFALGWVDKAVRSQRLAARVAPAARKSFHIWSLATLLHFAGDHEAAVRALNRALRLATKDRPLLHAHRAYVCLDQGRLIPNLAHVVRALRRSRCREGYGQFLLGMIAFHIEDHALAKTHLKAFLERNKTADRAKTITLQEEFRRARLALARIESC